MNILFLHPNFPGQFKHIAKYFAEKNEIKFLCQTHFGRKLKGVDRICLKGSLSHETLENQSLGLTERADRMGQMYRTAFVQLKEKNYYPDVVISHSAWGCGLHIKEIWPNCKQISYLEWWFNQESDFFWYDNTNDELRIGENAIRKYWLRNKNIALELSHADSIVALRGGR